MPKMKHDSVQTHCPDLRRLARRAEAWRKRCVRRYIWRILRRLRVLMACRRAESELGAMDDRALHDLGVGRGGIMYAARHGRGERRSLAPARRAGRTDRLKGSP